MAEGTEEEQYQEPDEPMPEEQTGFPCSSCGASLEFSPGSTKMECPYCGTDNEIELDEDAPEIEEQGLESLPSKPASKEKGLEGTERSFKCDSCGAVQAVASATIATECAFCGSETILEQPSNPDLIRPSGLVPFQFDMDAAHNKYRKWLSSWWRKLFSPGALQGNAAVTKIQGIYTPFFTFDAQAESDWSGMRGDHYYVTVGSGDNKRKERRTRWSRRRGHHSHFYDDVLMYASKGLPEKELGKIEPFHTKKLEKFSPQYLAGFSAEEYTTDPQQLAKGAEKKMYNAERESCRRELGGDEQRNLKVHTKLSRQTWKHILLPVYMATYLYGAKQFHFLVNGQTGEVQGTWPIHWGKVAIAIMAGLATAIGIARLTGNI